MGGKSIRSRAFNEKQRKRMGTMKLNDVLSGKNYSDNITTAEVTCKHCGFKVRYQFVRCPECNELQN